MEITKGNKLVCNRCGHEIGQTVLIDGVEFLQIGGMLSKKSFGFCINCGAEFHWSISDKQLERLLSRVHNSNML